MPTPKQNFAIYVKYKVNEKQKDWMNIFYDLNSAHQTNRLSGHESLMLAFTNSLRYYASSVEEKDELISSEQNNINYVVLNKVITNYLNHYEHQKIEQLQMVVGISSADGKKTNFHYYKN